MRRTILLSLFILILHATLWGHFPADSLAARLDSLQVTIQSAREAGDSLALTVLFQQRGALANQLAFIQLNSQPQDAVRYGNIALESAKQTADTLLAAQAHLNIGSGYLHLEDYRNAAEQFHAALGIYVRNDNRYGQCLSLNFLGVIFRELENYSKSEEYFRRSLEAAGDDKAIRIRIFSNLGNMYLKQKMFTDATDAFEEAYYLSEEIGNHIEAINSRIRIATVHHEAGELNRAYSEYRMILQQKDVPQKAEVLNRIGKVLMDRKDYSQAIDYLQQSEKEYIQLGDTLHAIPVMQNLAQTELELGDLDKAVKRYSQLDEMGKKMQIPSLIPGAILGMIKVYSAQKKIEKANQLFEQYMQTYDSKEFLPVTLDILKAISAMYRDQNDLRKAFETYDRYTDYLTQVHKVELDNQLVDLKERYETELLDYREEVEHERQLKRVLVEQWDDREKKIHQLLIDIENLEKNVKERQIALTILQEQHDLENEKHRQTLTLLIAIASGMFVLAGLLYFFWKKEKGRSRVEGD